MSPARWIAEHGQLWAPTLSRSAGRPQTVPYEVGLVGVAAVPIDIRARSGVPEQWQVRCVRVTPTPASSTVPLTTVSLEC
jgi:hypothetical protein